MYSTYAIVFPASAGMWGVLLGCSLVALDHSSWSVFTCFFVSGTTSGRLFCFGGCGLKEAMYFRFLVSACCVIAVIVPVCHLVAGFSPAWHGGQIHVPGGTVLSGGTRHCIWYGASQASHSNVVASSFGFFVLHVRQIPWASSVSMGSGIRLAIGLCFRGPSFCGIWRIATTRPVVDVSIGHSE